MEEWCCSVAQVRARRMDGRSLPDIRSGPESSQELGQGQDLDGAHLPGARFEADAQVSLQEPLLRQCNESFKVAGRNRGLGFDFDGGMVAEDEIHLEPRCRADCRRAWPSGCDGSGNSCLSGAARTGSEICASTVPPDPGGAAHSQRVRRHGHLPSHSSALVMTNDDIVVKPIFARGTPLYPPCRLRIGGPFRMRKSRPVQGL